MRFRLARWWPLLSLAGLLVPLVAFARMGGGEHFSGGFHSSSSHGEGGSGGGELVYWLIILTIEHPAIGVPTLCVVGVGYWIYQRQLNPNATTQRALARIDAANRTAVSAADSARWVGELRAADPAFQSAAFLDKAREIFLRCQQAWFTRNLEEVRCFMSDATFQRLSTQLRLLTAQGVRDAIADVTVLDAKIIGVLHDEWFDTVQVCIRAQMRDTEVPADTSDDEARRAAAKASTESFLEVWSFVRKPGVKTRPGQTLENGRCPNCGAPFTGGATNQCDYCKAVVSSGNYDWTLAEITQGSEVTPGARSVSGLAAIREQDPAFNLEMLEDRASLIFWKWITAQSGDAPKRLAKLATPALLDRLAQELSELDARGKHRVFRECAIGAVDTLGLRAGPEGQEARVEIRWSARLGVGPKGGPAPKLPTTPRRTIFTLTRARDAQTRTDTGMSTDRCPSCGAPLTDSLTDTCDYCGTCLSAGADWILQATEARESWDAPSTFVADGKSEGKSEGEAAMAFGLASAQGPMDGVPDVRDRERLLYMMAAIASTDGQVDGPERKLLRVCATRWSIPWKNVELALESGEHLFERLIPTGSPEAEQFLRAILQVAQADGRVDRKERRLLESAAGRLGLTAKLPAMLDRA